MTRTTANPGGDWRRPTHHDGAIEQQQGVHRRRQLCEHLSRLPFDCRREQSCRRPTDVTALGGVTGLQSIPNRNTMYAVEGGVLYIYDTNTGQLQSTQIAFVGALSAVVQVDK